VRSETAAGDAERGLGAIDEGLTTAREGKQHYADAFLHRLRGEIQLKHDPGNPAPPEAAFQTALAIAERQGGRSRRRWERQLLRRVLPFKMRLPNGRSPP
jgi:hypothetical protein